MFKLFNKKCKHMWIENHKHPMYHATRYCKKCGKIEIKAVKMDWCNNYAFLTKEEAERR